MSSSDTSSSSSAQRPSASFPSSSAARRTSASDIPVSPGDTTAVYFEKGAADERGDGIAPLPSGQQRFIADRRLSASTQQALFQAYFHALRTGQMPKPNMSPAITKAESQANHHRTISDAKKGVTYAGQEQLKSLPIPDLDETCGRYLQSVKPFLVSYHSEGCPLTW
jgi:hypothetical protein